MQKEIQEYLKNLEKKKEKAEMFLLGGVLCTTIMAGVSSVTSISGLVASGSAEIAYKDIRKEVLASPSFQNEIALKEKELNDYYHAGKMTIDEYNSGKKELYSRDSILEYADKDQDLVDDVASYRKSKEYADVSLEKAVPKMLEGFGVGVGATTVSAVIRRRYDRILNETTKKAEREM